MLTEKKTFLSFRLDKELFAINVSNVLEVLQMQKITKVPKTAEYIKGVVNFRGEIIPIIDTRLKFSLQTVEDFSNFVIIIINFNKDGREEKIGAIVDSVMDVVDYEEFDIKDLPELGSRYNMEFIYGMIRLENDFIMILNVDKVFSSDELSIVKNVVNNTESENKR